MRFFPFSELLIDDEFVFHYDYPLGERRTTDLFFKKTSARGYTNFINGECYYFDDFENPHSVWVSKIVVRLVP